MLYVKFEDKEIPQHACFSKTLSGRQQLTFFLISAVVDLLDLSGKEDLSLHVFIFVEAVTAILFCLQLLGTHFKPHLLLILDTGASNSSADLTP